MAHEFSTRVGRWTVKDSGVGETEMRAGMETISSDQMGLLEHRAAIAVLSTVHLVEGAEFKFARKTLGLTQTELAEHLGVGAETISRWENGAEAFKRPVQIALLYLLTESQRGAGLPKPTRSTNARERTIVAA